MSEPMTSGEIEDVLSSIRKLVSEDLRPQTRAAAPDVPDAPAEPEKLLLTPALRVVEGNAEAEATLAVQTDPEPARRLRLDAVVSTFAAQVNPPAEGWEAETGDATVTRLLRTPVQATPRDDGDVEPFPDAATGDDADQGRGATDAEVIDAPPAGGLHFAWQARRAGMGGDAAEDPEAEAVAAEADPLDDEDEPSGHMDADAVAELVRDILREELQGALGERMTRNIRKLVRAEVARVLATRDLA